MVNYEMPSFVNRSVNDVKKQLETNLIQPVILGNGDKVIYQSPSKNTRILEGETVKLMLGQFFFNNKTIFLNNNLLYL